MASQDRFGYEWDKYSALNPAYEKQFSDWVLPLTQKDFINKKVLDAGCGMGRNSYWALKWGAKEITAFDFDERSVEAARKVLGVFPNAKVLYKSIFDLDWQSTFDITFCIGVLHHLEDPQKAITKLTNATVSGGKILFWVYSYEGNEWIVRFVDPVRKLITSRLPTAVVHFLSYFASVPLWLFVKIFNGPTPYLKQLATFKFWHVHSIVFDQLIPEIAHYWKKNEILELFDESRYSIIQVERSPHAVGWTVCATKK